MKLHVIYKGQTVDISYDLLYINTDEVNIRFSNSNAQSCKFLTQYLEANRLDYVLKDREDYKEIVTLPDIFTLTLSTKGTYRSPVVKDNLYDAIVEHGNDIELAHNAIRGFKHNVKEDVLDKLEKYMYPEYVKEVEALGQDLLAELQEKAAKLTENEPNISEWIPEKCGRFKFEVKSESEDED